MSPTSSIRSSSRGWLVFSGPLPSGGGEAPMSAGDERGPDAPYQNRARYATATLAAGACVVAAIILAILGRDPTTIGLLLGFAGGIFGVAELNRRLR